MHIIFVVALRYCKIYNSMFSLFLDSVDDIKKMGLSEGQILLRIMDSKAKTKNDLVHNILTTGNKNSILFK